MFKKGILLLVLLNLILVNAFGKDRNKLDDKTKKELINVLETNEQLFNAFYEYDSKKVEESAMKLKDSIGKIDNQEISKLLSFSIKKLEEMKSSSSREDNDQAYHLVSMALIHIVNTYDVGDIYNAYSCPMVKKKWIQNSKKMADVNNPYAPDMPNCGSKDTSF